MSVHLRRKKLRDGRSSLYLDIYFHHQRKTEFLQFYLSGDKQTDKVVLQKAKEIQAQRQLDISLNRYGFSTEYSKDFWQFTSEFLSHKTYNSARVFNHMLKQLKKFSPDFFRFEQLTTKFAGDFGNYLLSTNLKTNTALAYYTRLRTLCHAAVREGLLQKNPCEPIRHKASEQPIRFLTFEEVQKLAVTPCKYQQVKNGFLFGCFCGLRISDVLALEWSHIQNNVLMLSQVKTGRVVRVPLSSVARQILLQQQGINPESPHCFVYPSYRVVRNTLREWSISAGLDKVINHHMSRHTFAVLALNSGIEFNIVSQLLGHSKLATTSIYAKLLDTTKAEAILKLPNL
ncbi:MAG TPA: site-specific integrase [Bacteroidota bacterium]|nr:site-specific integrase [Bacteroidota bacterium]